MGDTGAQIRQWFNYPNGTSDYLRLLNPNVLLNGHHPVVHTAIIGSCVQLGLSLFNSANASLIIYTCAQFVITAACMAYSISSLRKLGVSLPVRGAILLFFAFMPMFSNYAALLTKDVLFADAFWCCWYRPSSSWHVACPVVMPMPSVRANRGPCSLRATTGCCLRWLPWVPRFCAMAVWSFRWRPA